MNSFKILLALFMLSVVHGSDISIQVEKNVGRGSCNDGCSHSDGSGEESGSGSGSFSNLNDAKAARNLLMEEFLQRKEAVVKVYLAAVSVNEAGDVVNNLINALLGGSRRRHRRSADSVSFTGCEPSSPNITGTPADVTLEALEGILTELTKVGEGNDATKLNCSINIAKTLADGFNDSSIVKPNDTSAIQDLAESVLAEANKVEDLKAELVASLEEKNEEIENKEAEIVAAGGTVAGGEAPTMTLYAGLDQTGKQFTALLGPYVDLQYQRFNDVTKSIRGKGLWFLYTNAFYNERLEILASATITSQDLVAPQWNQLSSLRYAGSDDMSMEILTMYSDADQCGGSYIAVANMNYVSGFNDKASSFAITGNSAWTLYSDWQYNGNEIVCIKPYADDGFFYGYWNVADIRMEDNVISSIRKGCHSKNVFQFEP